MACIELTIPVQNKRFDGFVRDILEGEREILRVGMKFVRPKLGRYK